MTNTWCFVWICSTKIGVSKHSVIDIQSILNFHTKLIKLHVYIKENSLGLGWNPEWVSSISNFQKCPVTAGKLKKSIN